MTASTVTVARSDEKWVLIAAVLASAMAFIDTTALSVALPTLQSSLNADGTQLLWINNAYALFLSALIMVSGAMGDLYGRRRMFSIGIGWFTVASVLCGLAPDANFLIFARALQGIGAALMVPFSLAIISALIAPERRGQAIGTWSMFSTLTTILGPVIGGWLAAQGAWRAVFLINVPLAAIALYALLSHVPENRADDTNRGMDWPGAALVTFSLAAITFGFTEASRLSFGDPSVLISVALGVVALIAFVFVELRVQHPMVDLRVFRSRTFSGTNLLTLFLYAALSGVFFFVPLNLVQIQGYPSDIAGFSNLPFALLLFALSRWAGRQVDRIGARLLLIIGPALTGVGFFMLALIGQTNGAADYWTTFFPTIIVQGIGMGITIAPLTATVMSSVSRSSVGTASGINNAISRAAGVLAVAVLGAFALGVFAGSVQSRAAELSLTDEQRTAVIAESPRFADAQPPATLDDAQSVAVDAAYSGAFLDTFAQVSVIGAVLSWVSALMAAVFIEGRKPAVT